MTNDRKIMYYFYLFKCKDGSLYSGITNDIAKREKTHNLGKGSKYIRAHGGGKIIYSEIYKSISMALKREAEVKKFSRKKKLELVAHYKLSHVLLNPSAGGGEGRIQKSMKFKFTNQPFENEYPKLVRDKIPAIVLKNTGKTVKHKILAKDSDFLKYLCKKAIEEARELEYSLKKGNTKEEIADILEIIETIINLKRWKWSDVKKLQKEKRKKNGGFRKRILMLGVV